MHTLKDKKVIIIGGGGHARVLIDCLQLNGSTIMGITDIDSNTNDSHYGSIEVIGTDEVIFQYKPADVLLVNGLGFTEKSNRRAGIYNLFKNTGYSFANVIHPSVVISNDVVLSEGVQLMAGSVIQTGCEIGANSIINTSVAIDHDCMIAENVHIAPGTVLSGNVTIETNVFIGAGAIIIPGVTIGANSIVGSGSLVIQDIPVNTKAFGVPAKEVQR